MKNKSLLLALLLSAVVCLAPSCKKHDADPDPLSQLPPATQTGANTMGALVNGQAFVNHSSSFSGVSSTQCNYIFTNGGYYLTIAASNDSNVSYIINMALNTYQLSISEGQTLKLENRNEVGKACGLYGFATGSIVTYQTTSKVSGKLYITKFDQTNQILSGTFFFNAVNSKGDTVHVTDGRFDMKYTQ